MARRPERTAGRGGAALPARHARAGDDVRRRRRCGSPDRLHAAAERVSRPRPHRRGGSRQVDVATELVLRFDYGASSRGCGGSTTMLIAIAGPNAVRIDTPVELRGVDLKTVGDVHGRGGRPRAVRPHVVPLAPAGPGAGRRRRTRSSARRRTGSSGPAAAATTARGGAGRQLDLHAQGPHLRADRGHRRGADHLAAGVDRRRAELGLPVLLAAGRDAHDRRARRRGLSRRGPRVAQLALPGRRRRSGRPPDHVRRRRRAPPSRIRDRLAAGLRGLPAGAGRKRRRPSRSSSMSTAT